MFYTLIQYGCLRKMSAQFGYKTISYKIKLLPMQIYFTNLLIQICIILKDKLVNSFPLMTKLHIKHKTAN